MGDIARWVRDPDKNQVGSGRDWVGVFFKLSILIFYSIFLDLIRENRDCTALSSILLNFPFYWRLSLLLDLNKILGSSSSSNPDPDFYLSIAAEWRWRNG